MFESGENRKGRRSDKSRVRWGDSFGERNGTIFVDPEIYAQWRDNLFHFPNYNNSLSFLHLHLLHRILFLTH